MKSEALTQVQIMLSRWQNPSAWDRINQDEPLDPVEGKWVDNIATNVTSTGGTFTIPIGTGFTTSTGTILVQTGYSDIEHRILSQLAREDRDVFKAIEAACKFGDPRSTRAPGQHWEVSQTWNPYNQLPEHAHVHHQLPYARNHKEKRILKSLARKLPQMIRKAEMILGERGEMAQDKWNAGFWEMVTHESPVKEGRKRKV